MGLNVKWYHVIMFSLVPLALAFVGVIGGSFHGSDSEKEEFPEASAPPPSSNTPVPAPPGSTVLDITAQNTAFNTRSLSAPPNTALTVRVNNQDAGLLHNIAFYRSQSSRTQALVPGAQGTLFAGVATQQVSFTTPGPGTYFFQCDAHPDQMNGSFLVR